MTVVDNVFPQSGDADFAENFATWLGRGNISSYVETGLSFTVDYTTSPPTTDISQGKSYVIIDQATISSNSETRLVLDYAITTDAETGLALNDNETNNLIYLNPNVGTNDAPTFEVETTSGNAGATWLLVGVIDTSNNVSGVRNRNPDADYDALTARQSFGLPIYSEFSEASASESSTIFIDGNGTPLQGVYVYNGTEYISAGFREINQLNDVDGVEAIISDALTNRPAAGTQGSLFVDETSNRVQIDTGSSWVEIGTNPSNITASDLGFDTATQSELDTHIGTSNAHHNRPSAGNGLKDQSDTFNIEPTDFAGLFLNDNADNLEVQIGFGLEDDSTGQIQFDEDASYTFPNQQIINGVLTMGNNIDLQNNNLIELNQIQTSGSGSDVVTVQDTNAVAPILTMAEGGEVGLESGDLTDGAANIIYDQSAAHVPQARLQTDSLTVNANDGLTGGGSVALGSSVGIDINPADFAGTFLSEDSVNDLVVDIGRGLENDGTGQIQFDEDTSYTFSVGQTFAGGSVVVGDDTTDVALQQGTNPADSITDSTNPKDLGFAGDAGRDLHDQTDVTISNSSGASATEDITVTLYDGVDNTGTQLATETQSVTLADASSTTNTFLTGDVALNNGNYFIEVTQSGTALSIDSTTEFTKGASYTLDQTITGNAQLVNQDATTLLDIDAVTNDIGVQTELNTNNASGGRLVIPVGTDKFAT